MGPGQCQVQGAANVYEVQVLEDIQRIDQVLAREMDRVDAVLSLEGEENGRYIWGNLQLGAGEGAWEAEEGYESMDTDSLDQELDWEEQLPTQHSITNGGAIGEADRMKWHRFIRRLRYLWMDEDFNRLRELFQFWKVLSWRRISAVRKVRRAVATLRQQVRSMRTRRSAPLHLASSMKRRTFRRIERVIGIKDQALTRYVAASQACTLRHYWVGFLALRATRDRARNVRHVQSRHSWYLLKEHHRLWRRAQQVNRLSEASRRQLMVRHLHAWMRMHKALRFRKQRVLGRVLAAFRWVKKDRQERLQGLQRRHLQSRALKTWCTAYSTAVASCARADQAFQRRVFRRCLERWLQSTSGYAVLRLLGRVSDLYVYKRKACKGLLLLRLACEERRAEKRHAQEADTHCALWARRRFLSRWRQVTSAEAARDHDRVQQGRARTARRLATATFQALQTYSMESRAMSKATGYRRRRRLAFMMRRWRERAGMQGGLRKAYALAACMHETSSFEEALCAWRAETSVRKEQRAMVEAAVEAWQRRGKARLVRAWSLTSMIRAAECGRAKLAASHTHGRALSLFQHRLRQARGRRREERRGISMGDVWRRKRALSVAWVQLREEAEAQVTQRADIRYGQQWRASQSTRAALQKLHQRATCQRRARDVRERAGIVRERGRARTMRTAWILWTTYLRSIHRCKTAAGIVQRRRQREVLKECLEWWRGSYAERSIERQREEMAVSWARERQARYTLETLRCAAMERLWARQATATARITAARFLLRTFMPRLQRAAVSRRTARQLTSSAVDHCHRVSSRRALGLLQLAACRAQRKREDQALVHIVRTRGGFQRFSAAVRMHVVRTRRMRRSMALAQRAWRRLAQARVLERWLSVHQQTARCHRVRDRARVLQLASCWIQWRLARQYAQVAQGFQHCRQLRLSRQVFEAWRVLSATQASRRAVFVARQKDRARRSVLLAWAKVVEGGKEVRARAAAMAQGHEHALLQTVLRQWRRVAAEERRERLVLCAMQAHQQQVYLSRWRGRTLLARGTRMAQMRLLSKGMSRVQQTALAGRRRWAAQAVQRLVLARVLSQWLSATIAAHKARRAQLLFGLRRFKRGVSDCRRSRVARLRSRTLCLRAKRHQLSWYVHRWTSWLCIQRELAQAEKAAQARRATLSRCFAGWATLVQHKGMARAWLQRQHRHRLEQHAIHADVISN